MIARRPLLRVLLTSHISLALILWVPLMIVVALVITGVHVWGEIDRSIWHYVASQVPRWFALSLGVDAVTTYLRLNLAHGRTRRDFLRQLWPYLVGLAVCLAVLVTISYQLERGVYALAGWDHRIVFPTLYGGTDNVLGLIGVYALMLMLWAVAGVLLAAAFTRNVLLGVLTIPLGLVIAAPSEALVGLEGVPLLDRLTESLQFPVVAAVALSLACGLVGCVATWGIVRDIPLREKVA